ncbi:MAG TPA: hypothetical protein VFH93_03820, partial [Thermoleophilia bacterium]|nr:hypothetical protein [Thermoleophilia bacterium]
SAQVAANDYAQMGRALVAAERGDTDAASALLDDLSTAAASPTIRRAAQTNLDRLSSVADGDSLWLKWLVLAAGALLLSLQTYVLVGALAASPRRDNGLVWKVTAGTVAGLAAAVILALAFFDPYRSVVWVALALVVDLVIVLLVRRGTSGSSTVGQSA